MSRYKQTTTVYELKSTKTTVVHNEEVVQPVPIAQKLPPVRRVIVIDGCNVISKCSGTCYNIHSASYKFNALPLLMMINDLIKRKFEVFVTIKDYFMSSKTTNYLFVLEQLRTYEILHVFPDAVDDDRIILNTAKLYKGAIITNDKFRDKSDAEFGEEKKRRMDFHYELINKPTREMVPKKKFLFGQGFEYSDFNAKVLCFPQDEHYAEVKKMYDTIHYTYLPRTMHILDLMATYIQREQCYALGIPCPNLPYLLPNDMPEFYVYMEKRQSYEARVEWDKPIEKKESKKG